MLKNKEVKVGKLVPESRLYVCTKCGNVAAMLKGEKAGHCETCSIEGRTYAWKPTKQEILLKTKHVAKDDVNWYFYLDHSGQWMRCLTDAQIQKLKDSGEL